MKPFEALTRLGQVRRLRALAQAALEAWGLGGSRLEFVAHGENTTFRVDAPRSPAPGLTDGPYVPNRFLLRVHRPGYQTATSIASELAWLAALRTDAGLPVPEPVPSLGGKLLVESKANGVPQSRMCSLLRWVKGRNAQQRVRLRHFRELGRLMARLHEHTANWQLPPSFERRHWDWEGLYGDDAGFGLRGSQVWVLLPQPYQQPFERVASQAGQVMAELGKGDGEFGLIHADLCLGEEGNVVFAGGEARPIDFDDCGFGWWVYDFAVPLCHWREAESWPKILSALLDGYAQIRPLPEEQLVHLELFMAARHVSEILWAVDLAQVNPQFREELDGWAEWAAMHVRRYLDRC